MGLDEIIKGLKLQAKRDDGVYAAARAEDPVLATYATAAEAFDALARGSGVPARRRQALTLAVIHAQRKNAHPQWQALLVRAYEPMLDAVCRTRDEADAQDVVLAFLEAVDRAPDPDSVQCISTYLRVFTERTLARVAQAAQEPETIRYREGDFGDGTTEAKVVAALDLRNAMARERSHPELAEAMYATLVEEEALRSYIARRYAHVRLRDHGRIYEQLRRQQYRLIARLRMRLGIRWRFMPPWDAALAA